MSFLYRLLIAGLLALSLLGCSPTFDWRTVISQEHGYSALFPAKPTQAERTVDIQGIRLPMTLSAARVDDMLFAIGVVELGVAHATLHDSVLSWMEQGLTANLHITAGSRPTQRSVELFSASTPPVRLTATEIHLTGVAQQDGAARRLTVWLVAKGTRVYQVMVLEAGDRLRDKQAITYVEEFLRGFHPF